MYLEILSVGLGVSTAIAGTLAYAYKRGKVSGIDLACGKRIEDKLDAMKTEGDTIHNELREGITSVRTKIDRMEGSFETFKKFINLNK